MTDRHGAVPMDTDDTSTASQPSAASHAASNTQHTAQSHAHDAKERARALFDLYVRQFTAGCGITHCPTAECASNDSFAPLTPQQAAAKAIQTMNAHKESQLCPNLAPHHGYQHPHQHQPPQSSATSEANGKPATPALPVASSATAPIAGTPAQSSTPSQSQLSSSSQPVPSRPQPPAQPARVVRSVQPNDFVSLMNACNQQLYSATPSPSTQGNPFAPVIRLVGEVFADAESLEKSFSEVNSHGQVIAPTGDDPSIDWIGVDNTFALLMANDSINIVLQSAIRRLITPLATRAPTVYPLEQLRVLFMLLQNPANNDVEFYDTFKLLCKCLSVIKDDGRETLVKWLSDFSNDKLTEQLAALQQYITVTWFTMSRIDDVFCAVAVMKLVHEANQRHQQRGYNPLIPYQSFYNDAVNENADMKEDYKRWRGLGRYTGLPPALLSQAFAANSFVLDAGSKSRLLQVDAHYQMSHYANNAMIQSLFSRASPYLVLRVHRASLVSDTLTQIQHLQPMDYKKPLKVVFHLEQGQDEGGVKKEFFQLIMAELFNPMYGMFTINEETHHHEINSQSLESQREFELIGVILGLALYNSVILDLRFPLLYYKKLLNLPLTLADLKEIRPQLAKGFEMLLSLDGSVDVQSLYERTFSIDIEIFGETKTVELKPGGATILLTNDNREEYVRLYTDYVLNDSIDRQFKAFRAGFDSCVNREILELFHSDELMLAIIGSEELNFDALQSTTRYEGYSKDDAVIQWFWSLVHGFDRDMKKKLLSFCTGSDRVPIRGLGALRLTIAKNGEDSPLLPTSSTCFNVLLLPQYSSKEKLDQCLQLALQNAIGFGLI